MSVNTLLSNLSSPILFHGTDTTAYRDPAAIFVDGTLHLFFTLVETEPGETQPYLYTAASKTTDFVNWTAPRKLTPRDRSLNYSSPGNIVRFGGEYLMCLQTYPRPSGEKYGNATSRIWTMRSADLELVGAVAIASQGPDVADSDMGRMIDPYLIEDKDEPGKWWCFFKQNGVSRSWSRDLERWTYIGRHEAGENACVIVDNGEYILFHSPENGIGVSRSNDLISWTPEPAIMLDAANWDWAKGRLTAGFALDLRGVESIGKYVLFFHGSGPEPEETMFDNYASIGIAWSDDLKIWEWPK